MSGTAVIRYLLANASAVTAVVPAARIQDNDAPVGALMPFIEVDDVDTIPRDTIKVNESNKLYTERVQVRALCKGQYGTPQGDGKAGCKALIKLIVAACPNQFGTVNGVTVDSIIPDQIGPNLHSMPEDLWSKSCDFFVKWIGP